ncbi:MAG TPA: polyprenyl synthetase family protein [Spirochaetia bacterium]
MRSFWEGRPEIERDLEEVRRVILGRSETDDPGVREAIEQLLASSGKMLRPGFVLLASRFGRPDRDRMIRIGAAVEMLHMATLVHDDIIDGARMRRGVATLHTVKGPRVAVLAGDWLLATSFSLVSDLYDVENSAALARLVARICGSEISQSADRFIVHTSIRRYLRRIAGKTAALFALSLYAGAVESDCPPGLCATLRRLGYCLGMGFQIVDDILDFRHEGAATGKPTGSDLAQGVVTLPAILVLRDDHGPLGAAIGACRRSRRAAARAAGLVVRSGGLEKARVYAETFTRRAIAEIERLPAGAPRDTLRDVTEKLLHRTY